MSSKSAHVKESFLTLLNVPRAFTEDDFANLPYQAITEDYFGNALPRPVSYRLVKTPESLFFSVKVPQAPSLHPDLAREGYVEGLWEADVAELFIGEEGKETYHEYNLSPTGAWWSMGFLGTLVRDPRWDQRSELVQTKASSDSASWQASLILSRDIEPLIWTDVQKVRLNATLILRNHKCPYLSAAPLPGTKPDFHQQQALVALKEVSPRISSET